MKNQFLTQVIVSTVSALAAYYMVRQIDKRFFKKEDQVFSNLGNGTQRNFDRSING